VLDIPAVRMHTVPGFETAVFPYTTDVPLLGNWGTPMLLGPGSIHVAHTDEEHVGIDELHAAVGLYAQLALRLLH
jgi:acetylornithine deacetylase